jgi:serine/threonine protein kinase
MRLASWQNALIARLMQVITTLTENVSYVRPVQINKTWSKGKKQWKLERERERERMGNLLGTTREREDDDEEEQSSQKRGKSDLALLAEQYVAFSAGGNACILKAKDGRSILRISNAKFDPAEHQSRLHDVCPWFVPAISILHEYTNYEDFIRHGGKSLERIMKPMVDCAENLVHFESEQNPIRITKMAFIQGTDLDTFRVRFQQDKELKILAFRMLAGLYVLQREIGFEHGDMTGTNVMIAIPGDMAPFMPTLIDFDFAVFFPQISAERDHGTFHIVPLEFTREDPDIQERTVRGAVDIWSFGVCLFSIMLTGNSLAFSVSSRMRSFLAIEDLSEDLDDEVVMQILHHFALCAMHALLMNTDHTTYPMHGDFRTDDGHIAQLWPLESRLATRDAVYANYRKRFLAQIRQLPGDMSELLKRLLHRSPRERTFNGNVASYFDMPCFAALNDKDAVIAKFVLPYLKGNVKRNALPNIGDNIMGQIRNMHAFGIVAKCVDCSAPPHYYDTHRERLVCANCSNAPVNWAARQFKQKALNDDIVIYGAAMNMLNNPHNHKYSTFSQDERNMLHYYASQGAIYRK